MADEHTLAGQAGLDLWLCEFCEERVALGDDYIQGIDGMRAHRDCVLTFNERFDAEV